MFKPLAGFYDPSGVVLSPDYLLNDASVPRDPCFSAATLPSPSDIDITVFLLNGVDSARTHPAIGKLGFDAEALAENRPRDFVHVERVSVSIGLKLLPVQVVRKNSVFIGARDLVQTFRRDCFPMIVANFAIGSFDKDEHMRCVKNNLPLPGLSFACSDPPEENFLTIHQQT